MENKDWIKLLDKYLTTNTMLSSEYEQLDDYQKCVIQELKRAFKRLKNKLI